MSNKRPLSPESTNGCVNNDIRSLKRLKLHSIIQELRNEEANLVILKKLRTCQQLTTRINTSSSAAITSNNSTTNGFHPTATRMPVNTKLVTSIPPSSSSSRSSLQPAVPAATRKPAIPTNPPLINKLPTSVPNKNANLPGSYSLEERKAQAKKALRHQLERDLLNIPSPKPLLQDILFVPNPNSLEFQPYVGLEDVVQCLYELQADRHRLPQRFTDRAQIDEPYVCDHCGTDFTIRWWKHLNASNSLTNILCDRCKKQVTRRTLKSDHSSLLKNVFVSAMDQEKEIEKSFQTLMKQQQKSVSRSSTSSSPSSAKALPANRPLPSSPIPSGMPSINPTPAYPSPNNHHSHSKPKAKTSVPQLQNFATKLSQQSAVATNATRKPSAIPQPQINSTNHIRSNQHTKTAMLTHHHAQQQQQQQYRSATAQPPPSQHSHQSNNLQISKVHKSAARQQSAIPQRSSYVSGNPAHPAANVHPSMMAAAAAAAAAAANARPTATKRRTVPSVNMK